MGARILLDYFLKISFLEQVRQLKSMSLPAMSGGRLAVKCIGPGAVGISGAEFV
ncbi:hypothetical protein D3C78_1028850 [compost metagenome]